VRVGQWHFRREDSGGFTDLDPSFHDLVAYRATADRALARFAKGDSFVAEGYVRTFEVERDGEVVEREEFVAKEIGHDLARTNSEVDRTRRSNEGAARNAPAAAQGPGRILRRPRGVFPSYDNNLIHQHPPLLPVSTFSVGTATSLMRATDFATGYQHQERGWIAIARRARLLGPASRPAEAAEEVLVVWRNAHLRSVFGGDPCSTFADNGYTRGHPAPRSSLVVTADR